MSFCYGRSSTIAGSSTVSRSKPDVDELRYTPGAVVWRVDRENVGRSQMNRIVGTPLYKKITIRSANTMRKLNELTATPTRT